MSKTAKNQLDKPLLLWRKNKDGYTALFKVGCIYISKEKLLKVSHNILLNSHFHIHQNLSFSTGQPTNHSSTYTQEVINYCPQLWAKC